MTEVEYEQALARIEALMDAGQGTPELEELERLVVLVEAYEAEHYPIPAPEPSDEWKASVRELAAEYDKASRALPPEAAAMLFDEEVV